jgi:hypothetical protein
MPEPADSSLARNLGAFFGHIAKAIRTTPDEPRKVEVNRSVEEHRQEDGVVLRRTTVDEVVLPPGATPPRGESSSPREASPRSQGSPPPDGSPTD